VPAYRPNPPWAWTCTNQGPHQRDRPFYIPDVMPCEPMPRWLDHSAIWFEVATRFISEAVARVDCRTEARDVWAAYFDATGSPRFVWDQAREPASCVIRSLSGDPSHDSEELPIVAHVETNLSSLLPRLRGAASVRVPFAAAGVPPPLLTPPLTFNVNTRIGGQLFGGVAGPSDHPRGIGTNCGSEYGADTRAVDGVVELVKEVDATDPSRIWVTPRFEFDWRITDAVDFCPGNTGERAHYQVRAGVVAASVLEASGMARDIYVEARYRRTRTGRRLGPFPNPDPAPPTFITVPAEALFGFDQSHLSPRAEQALRTRLGDAPAHHDPSRPVRVRGHADSVPGPTPDYNLQLSKRRAEAVRAFLEREYPNLRGHVVAEGFGDTVPVAPNDTAEGRARNRRVEIELDRRAP